MVGALVGWLGLTIVVVAGVAALAADLVRQARHPIPEAAENVNVVRATKWLGPLTIAAFALAVVAAAATVVRLAALT